MTPRGGGAPVRRFLPADELFLTPARTRRAVHHTPYGVCVGHTVAHGGWQGFGDF
jgi:hypothetical protein